MEDERDQLTAFLNIFLRRVLEPSDDSAPGIPPGTPLRGLREADGDMLEMTAPMSAAEITNIEDLLREAGAPSLASVRLRYSKRLSAVLKRGEIRNDAEYRLVRAHAEQDDSGALWALVGRYDQT